MSQTQQSGTAIQTISLIVIVQHAVGSTTNDQESWQCANNGGCSEDR